MKLKREVALVLNEDMEPLNVTLGKGAFVLFPDEFIWDFHHAHPGYVKYLVHSHPPKMTEMSEEDRTTCKAWCLAFAPYKLNFYVVTHLKDQNISIKNYWYELETLEKWKKRGKKGERKMTLHEEDVNWDTLPEKGWLKILLELSYE